VLDHVAIFGVGGGANEEQRRPGGHIQQVGAVFVGGYRADNMVNARDDQLVAAG
jgi:hypothetical protein